MPAITATGQPTELQQPTKTPEPTPTPTIQPTKTHTPLPTLMETPTLEEQVVWASGVFPLIIDRFAGNWSPVADEMISIRNTNGETGPVALASAPEFVPETINLEGFSFVDKSPDWSPDGRYILFFGTGPDIQAEEGGSDDVGDLWVMDKDGLHPRRVPPEEYTSSLWFPGIVGWINESAPVISEYTGGGTYQVSIIDLLGGRVLADAVFAGAFFKPNRNHVPAINTERNDSYLFVVETNPQTLPPEMWIRIMSDYARVFPYSKYNIPPIERNMIFDDWLSGTNKVLATWFTYDMGSGLDGYITAARLLFWDVDRDVVIPFAPGGVDGRFSPDGKWLAYITLGSDSQVNKQPLDQLTLEPVSRDDRTFLKLLEIENDQEILNLPAVSLKDNMYFQFPVYETVLNFSPDSRYLAFLTAGSIRVDDTGWPVSIDQSNLGFCYLNILDLKDKRLVRSLPSTQPEYWEFSSFTSGTSWPVWSPRSNRIAYRDQSGNWQVYDLVTGNVLPLMQAGGQIVKDAAWSYDGHYLKLTISETDRETIDSSNPIIQTAILGIP